MALELILRRHDSVAGKGVPFANTILHTLGYADDVGLIDHGDISGCRRATERVTRIAAGSRADADMEISISKTKVPHVRRQDSISVTTSEEAKEVCKFTCPHLHCGYKFYSKRGMQIHAGKCQWANKDQFVKILDCEGSTMERKYQILWEGDAKEKTGEPRGHIHPSEIVAFEKANGFFDYQWRHRCPICELPMNSQRGVKIHCAKMHKPEQEQDFKNRLADKAVQKSKL